MKWSTTAGPKQTKLVQAALDTMAAEHSYTVEIRGTHGKPETEFRSVLYGPFCGNVSRPDVTLAHDTIGKKFNWQITPENHKAVAQAIIDAMPALIAARPVKDLRRTPQEESILLNEREQAAAKRELEAEEHARELQLATEKLRVKYPWAVTDRKKSSHARGGANLKRELELAFPGTKFSAKSDSFSMGDSITVHWAFGPTTSQVEAISSQYQEGSFDGMDDSYNYDDSAESQAHCALLGGAKYVHTTRHYGASYSDSESFYEKIGRMMCDLQRVEYNGTDTRNVLGEGDDNTLRDHLHQFLSKTAIPAGAEIVALEHANSDADFTWCKPVFKMPATPTPGGTRSVESPAPETAPLANPNTSSAFLSANPAKGGLELRFPEKPTEETRNHLKQNGWRWSRFAACWWTKDTPEARTFAATLIGAPRTVETKAPTAPIVVAPPAPMPAPVMPAPQLPAPTRAGLQRYNPSADIALIEPSRSVIPVTFTPSAPQPVAIESKPILPAPEDIATLITQQLSTPTPTPNWKTRLMKRG